jgi:L-alanine-DL-glutamate epimerase-like enolase superfamily enzyme
VPKLTVSAETWPLARAFVISRWARTETTMVVVEVAADGAIGRGESGPNQRYEETPEHTIDQIEAIRPDIERGMERDELQARLPAGAARNALDCALWDLECKRRGVRAWELAGIERPKGLVSAITISMEAPEVMEERARSLADRPLIKIKVGSPDDVERLLAVRRGAPAAKLIVDANEGWDAASFAAFIPELVAARVNLLEQPLPAGRDDALADIECPVPVCADESCHTSDGLEALVGKYDFINIKLDKSGGLTEALRLADLAAKLGFGLMVGSMLGTSLAMAPAMIVGSRAEFIDLDGPLLLARDREPGIDYKQGRMGVPAATIWG